MTYIVTNDTFFLQIVAKNSCSRKSLVHQVRAKWMLEGNANTRFFNACIKGRRRRNNITGLQVGDMLVDSVVGIKNEVKNFFQSHFSSNLPYCRPLLDGVKFPQVSTKENNMSSDVISDEEVKRVAWECDGNKSPGPDCFNLSFNKSASEIIQNDVMSFLHEF